MINISIIYVVEDDEDIQELILASLRASGYNPEGFLGYTELLQGLQKATPDLILLDIMLPGKNGLEIITELKGQNVTKNIPVIFLTAKGSEIDKVKGLELGAEDYITKPFGVLEFLARIKTALRRGSQEDKIESDLTINFESKEVSIHGRKIKLTFKEFELLAHLYNNPGIVLSRESLLSKAWDYSYEAETTRTVDVHIKSIRHKLLDRADNPKYIETVRGYGYKFIK